MARSLKRHIETVAWASNGISRIPIPRNHFYKKLMLRLSLDVTVTAAGGTGGALHDEQPWSVLRQLSVIRNGAEVLQRIDGGSLARMAQITYGTVPETTALASSAAQANTIVTAVIPLDFAMLQMRNPASTFLRAVGTSSLELEVVWGSVLHLIAGGNETNTINSGTLEVYSDEIMDIKGDPSDRLITVIEREIVSSSNSFAIELPVGERYRRLYIKTSQQKDDPAAPGTPVGTGFDLTDALINAFTLRLDGTLVLMDGYTNDAMRGANKALYSLEAMPVGYQVIDFAEDGSRAGLIDTAGASNFRLILDVNAPGVATGTVAGANAFVSVIAEQTTLPRVPITPIGE